MIDQSISCQFKPGQIVYHTKEGYRGVIVDMMPYVEVASDAKEDDLTEEKLENAYQAHGPQMGYWLLVDQSEKASYVPETLLVADQFPMPVTHPLLNRFFTKDQSGHYVRDYDA